MVTRAWKVYGLNEHRQKVSFQKSCQYDLSNEKYVNTCFIWKKGIGDKYGN